MTTSTPLISISDATADRDGAVRVLSAAFQTDPVFEWWIPDSTARAAALPTVFDAYLDGYAPHEASRIAIGRTGTAAASIWARPGSPLMRPEDEEALVSRCVSVVDDGAAVRLQQIGEAFDAVHPHDPHWYLQFLATEPQLQGRGFGGVLLQDVLTAADEAGEAAYTEATSLRNRALYERHGFEFVREIPLPDGPSLYALWRDPR
jgi:ribosomal protein S18 acetylase RimI-like enzyme